MDKKTTPKGLDDKLNVAFMQRAFARAYNIQLKLLNVYGLADIIHNFELGDEAKAILFRKLENYFSKKEVFEGDLKIIALEPMSYKVFNENISNGLDEIDLLFAPRLKKDFRETDAKRIRDKLVSSIYFVFPDGFDPIYNELKQYSRHFQLYCRYYYASILYYYNYKDLFKELNKNTLIIFNHPIGFQDSLLFQDQNPILINNNVLPLVSNFWLKELKEYGDIGFEAGLLNLYDSFNETEKLSISFQTQQYLLSQVLVYYGLNISNLFSIQKSFGRVISLLKETGIVDSEMFCSLSPEEKHRMFEAIPFFISLKIKKLMHGYFSSELVQNLINNEKREKEKAKSLSYRLNKCLGYLTGKTSICKHSESYISNISLKIPISDSQTPKLLVLSSLSSYSLLELEMKAFRRISELNLHTGFSLAIQEGKHEHKTASITIQAENVKKETLDALSNELKYYLNKGRRDTLSRMHFKYRSLINLLNHEFEKIDVSDVKTRCSLLVKHTMQIVFAYHAIYFDYNSIENKVDPLVFEANLMFSQSADPIQTNQNYKQKVASVFKTLTDEQRKISNIYKCIDQRRIVSKYDYDKSNPYDPIFSSGILSADENSKGIEISELVDNDRIGLPILGHNRKIGVLYLVSSQRNHFHYLDRINLLNLVQLIGAEIFEAKLFNCIMEMNSLLQNFGANIKTGKYEQLKFGNSIATQIAELFGASGAVLLWKSTMYGYAPIGSAGIEISKIFGESLRFTGCEELLAIARTKKPQSLVLNDASEDRLIQIILSSGFKGGIIIPLDSKLDTEGYIVLFDKYKCSLSQSLSTQCTLIGKELIRILGKFYDQICKLSFIQGLLTHDISGKLRSIKGIRNNLDEYSTIIRKHGDWKRRIDYDSALNDIDGYTEAADRLLEYFANEFGNPNLTSDSWKVIGIKAFTDLHKNLFTSKDNIQDEKAVVYEVVKSVLHGKEPVLKENNVKWKIRSKQEFKIPYKGLWINSTLLLQMFENLIDNIVKYAVPNSTFIIEEIVDITGWNISLSNICTPVSSYRNLTTEDFVAYGQRFADPSKSGKGKGLYFVNGILNEFGSHLEVFYQQESENKAKFKVSVYLPFFLGLEDNPWK